LDIGINNKYEDLFDIYFKTMNTNESKPKQTQFDFNNVNSCLSNQNSIEFNCKDNYLYRTSLIAVSS